MFESAVDKSLSKKMPEIVEEYENWMGQLSPNIRNKSVIHLAIPGSHNSMSYGITRKSRLAPDAEKVVRRINKIFPCVVRRWAITQNKDALEQLQMGVRYFDLRIVAKESRFYFAHGLYSFEISEPLWNIRIFLDLHPKEVVILDFQHFYNFQDRDHLALQRLLRNIFQPKIYARVDGPLVKWTLSRAEDIRKQVVIIYRKFESPEEFWPSFLWPTPWPNTVSTKRLREFLVSTLQRRNPQAGYVSQCILTPTPSYIVLRFFLSLKFTAKKVNKRLSDWINEQRPGPFKMGEDAKVNVILGDFVSLNERDFCKKVIALNQYLDEE